MSRPTQRTAVPTAQTAGVAPGIDLVVFSAGAHRCAIEARLVLGISEPRPREATALATLLGGSPSPSARQRLIAIRAQDRRVAGSALRVEEPIRLCHARVVDIHPLPPLIGALKTLPCLSGLAELACEDDHLAVLIDPFQLEDPGAAPPDGITDRIHRVTP
jgi:hypothetical protein